MIELFHDSSFWVLIAFIIFVILVIVKASSKIGNILEGKAIIIKNKIKESEGTLKEAQDLLKKSQIALKNYKDNSKNLISMEKQKAIEKAKDRIKNIELDIERKEKSLEKEIEYLRQNIITSIRKQIIDITINSTQNLISNNNNAKASDQLFKEFLTEVPNTISSNSVK
ncbi:MAG: ATP synthase subunit b [Alphaproteobacteria bacterium MarineAlpha9_Bin2]|nr:MAG: ATP synthase subunit b [Alphaproteobacteria bacterium MarineAlpha9_Bin2]